MQVKYRIPAKGIGFKRPKIEKVEVVRETEKSLTMTYGYNNDQTYCYHKRNNFYDFCDTFEEAKKTLLFSIDEELTDKKKEMIELVDLREQVAGLTE